MTRLQFLPRLLNLQDLSHCVDILSMILSDIWQALFGESLPEDQKTVQVLKEMETLWKIIEKDTEKAGQRE